MGTPAAGAAHSPLRLSAPRLCPGLLTVPSPAHRVPSRLTPQGPAGPALALTAPDSAPWGACRRWALLIPARGLAGRVPSGAGDSARLVHRNTCFLRFPEIIWKSSFG